MSPFAAQGSGAPESTSADKNSFQQQILEMQKNQTRFQQKHEKKFATPNRQLDPIDFQRAQQGLSAPQQRHGRSITQEDKEVFPAPIIYNNQYTKPGGTPAIYQNKQRQAPPAVSNFEDQSYEQYFHTPNRRNAQDERLNSFADNMPPAHNLLPRQTPQNLTSTEQNYAQPFDPQDIDASGLLKLKQHFLDQRFYESINNQNTKLKRSGQYETNKQK